MNGSSMRGSRTRLLMIGNFLSGSGGTRGVCEDLADRLISAGWPVLFASSKPGKLRRLWDMLSTARAQRDRYDVAHVDVFSGPAFLWAELVCWILQRSRKPYVLTLHGGNLPEFARRWPRRVRRLLGSATVATAPSGYLREQLRAYRKDLQLLPNPVDVVSYPFRLRERPTPSLMWLRAFHEIYNPSLAVQTLALLTTDFPDARLTMIGPDKGDRSLQSAQRLAGKLGLDRQITFVPGVPKTEVPRRLLEADIFLNTANIDNTPISLIEAMASGMCIVSTRVGGIPYLLDHEKDALLAQPGEAEDMAHGVRRILTEAGLAGKLSRNARSKAQQFDWRLIFPRWEALLRSVADKSAA